MGPIRPRLGSNGAMSDATRARPRICLNMIIRNEAHIIGELFDSIAPYIDSWVIVDTGSVDGSQDVVRGRMAALGIPGELHERPWQDFGRNRSEALTLAQGHGDYIWVLDADDIVMGTIDFAGLDTDAYEMRYSDGVGFVYWRYQLFRDGLPWYYVGVVHEFVNCDQPVTQGRLEGDYYIESRRLGSRNLDADKYARDRDLLLAQVQRDPTDARSAFYLAQSYFDLGDFAGARDWYARRAVMSGWDEESFFAMYRVGISLSHLDAPLPDVQDAFLRAWEFRPIRAEPLHAIAVRYRIEERYLAGYLFAERAARIPFCDHEKLFVDADVYAWRAVDEQAVCGYWIGRHGESFTLCRNLLQLGGLPEDERGRIAANRDFSVPTMIDAALAYPQEVVDGMPVPLGGDVTVTLVAGPDRSAAERSLNSFLRSCQDLDRIGRFLVVDAGLSDPDRQSLRARYGFLEFGQVAGTDLAGIRSAVEARFWLHLGSNWVFFAPDPLIGRLTAILDIEPEVFQVGVNYGDASGLTGAIPADEAARRAERTGRYVIADAAASGPAMFDTARLDLVLGAGGFATLGGQALAAGLRTASLDEVLCVAGPAVGD